MSPLRTKGTPILLRARAPRHTRKWFTTDAEPNLGPPALPETRSHLGRGRHRVARLQQSVLWR